MIVINRRTLPAMTLRRYRRRTDPSVEKLPPAVQTAIHTHTLQRYMFPTPVSQSALWCFDLLYFTMLESQCGLKFT